MSSLLGSSEAATFIRINNEETTEKNEQNYRLYYCTGYPS